MPVGSKILNSLLVIEKKNSILLYEALEIQHCTIPDTLRMHDLKFNFSKMFLGCMPRGFLSIRDHQPVIYIVLV